MSRKFISNVYYDKTNRESAIFEIKIRLHVESCDTFWNHHKRNYKISDYPEWWVNCVVINSEHNFEKLKCARKEGFI